MMIRSMHPQLPAVNTAEFASVARNIAAESRRLGLSVPGFRCPPRIVGVDRTLRRFVGEETSGIVAVAVKGRPLAAVVADMIEGVVILNRLVAADAARVRAALWQALDHAAGNSLRHAELSGNARLDAHVA